MPRGSRAGQERASGKTAATEEAERQADKMAESASVEMPEETEQWFRSPGFQRMRTSWSGEDAKHMQRVTKAIDDAVFDRFSDAYAVMSDIYDVVREPEVDTDTGEVKVGPGGFVVWRRTSSGGYIEDWTRLTSRQKEDFLFRITTSLFVWELRAVEVWTDAMMAKALFTEHFAIEYDKPMTGTIDDRNARGNVAAAEDRYFALFCTAVSRKAEAIVRTMNSLALRLRDTLGG